MLVYCGQTAGWIRIPLGTEVGLGPGDIVLDDDQLPPQKRAQQPLNFRPMSIVAKRTPMSATAELLFKGPDKAPKCAISQKGGQQYMHG